MKAMMVGAAMLVLQPALAAAQDRAPRGDEGRARGAETRLDAVARAKARFARMDANGDGVVTRAEFEAFREARRGGDGLPPPPPGEMPPPGDRPPPPEGGTDRPPPPPGHGMGMAWFTAADTDGDGRVTAAEAEAFALALFDRVDANHDGTILPDERDAARAMMRGRMEDRRER